MALYSLCGFSIRSNVHLPELPPARMGEPRCEFQVVAADGVRPAPAQWFHHWLLPDGQVWLSFARDESGYLLRFPNLADFRVDAAGRTIRCQRMSCVPLETIRHLFLDQIVPLVLSKWGKLVLHASAIATAAGAIAFVGVTGVGKSTVATSFADQGFPLVTDDCLLMEERGEQYIVHPSYPGVRLWDDARAALLGQELASTPVAHYTEKKRLDHRTGRLPFCTQPVPLKRAYFLSPQQGGDTTPISIAPLSRRESFLALVRFAYKLDIADRGMLKEEFASLGRLVGRPFFYRLAFPKDFSLLPTLREAILEHLGEDQQAGEHHSCHADGREPLAQGSRYVQSRQ